MIHAIGIDHITITVSDLHASEDFYNRLMKFLGLKKAFSEYGFAGWRNSGFQFYISEAELPYKNEKYVKHRPGLNHFSFRADSRKDVDTLYAFLQKHNIKIITQPTILKQWGRGMYYIAFEDPDGIKLEFGYPLGKLKIGEKVGRKKTKPS